MLEGMLVSVALALFAFMSADPVQYLGCGLEAGSARPAGSLDICRCGWADCRVASAQFRFFLPGTHNLVGNRTAAVLRNQYVQFFLCGA